MKILTEGNVIVCPHPPGNGSIRASQSLVRIEGRRVLVLADPVGTSIQTCPNTAIPNLPCSATLTAEDVSYSPWLGIEGRRICRDATTGVTNGSPPGTPKYRVARPGQALVTEIP